ncbi:MAG TPA: EAL domain-containing protein [Acidimicrobiales bacterium]
MLVVDDDATVRVFEVEVLRSAGYDVVDASDGESALELLIGSSDAPGANGAVHVDVVLLDNQLPGMNGDEVVRRLRETPGTRTLPVILVTADEDVADRVAGLDAGADDYVIKPFSPAELLARVSARMRERTAWGEILESHLAERAAVARVLRAAAAEGSLEDRAQSLCDAFSDVRAVGGAAIVVFDDDVSATVIATAGDAPWAATGGSTLPPAVAKYLAMRAAVGPWVDGRESGEPSGLLLEGRAACAPIGPRDRVNGLLAVVPAGPDANAALATGIDFATMTEGLLRRDLDHRGLSRRRRVQIEQVLSQGSFVAHFQPIVSLTNGKDVVGAEALTRFDDGAAPEARFRYAASVGLGLELERMTLERALRDSAALPDGEWVSVNVSPALILDDLTLPERLSGCEREIVLELSEHDPVDDYVELRRRVRRMSPSVRLSVDDAGSGFASLRHILLLEPEYVKLDRSWVQNVDADPARQALIAGLRHFAEKTGCHLIAEGIETDAERRTLEDLGVDYGQGFLLGMPAAVAVA